MLLDLSIPHEAKAAGQYLGKLASKSAKIELKEIRPKRSLSQNSYLHVCFSLVALELGYSLHEVKTLLKREYGEGMFYTKNGQKFLKSTSDLDSLEMTHFIDWLRAFSMDQFGCYIPTSEEYLENQFQLQKQTQYAR